MRFEEDQVLKPKELGPIEPKLRKRILCGMREAIADVVDEILSLLDLGREFQRFWKTGLDMGEQAAMMPKRVSKEVVKAMRE